MISKLSSKVACKFIDYSNGSYNDIEIYKYGFFIIFSNIIFFALTLLLGIMFNVTLSSIIFYLAFSSIRQYAGGYHASSETKCNIITSCLIFTNIIIIKLSTIYNLNNILLLSAILSFICIFLFSPLDTHEKPLSKKEKEYYGKISKCVLIVILCLIGITYNFQFRNIFSSLCMSLNLECILLIMGKIKIKCI